MRSAPDGSLLDPQGFIRVAAATPPLLASLPPEMARVISQGDAEALQHIFRRARLFLPHLPA
jgi:hypothetical protein